jgi:DNA-binding CsgD family transcriptional regulator
MRRASNHQRRGLRTPLTEKQVFKEKFALTPRESDVLIWISKGKSNRDIAEILGLSPRTVNKHLEQIYAKLGVENRTGAAAVRWSC